MREAIRLVRGLCGLQLVGADLAEVSPPFDIGGGPRSMAPPCFMRCSACWRAARICVGSAAKRNDSDEMAMCARGTLAKEGVPCHQSAGSPPFKLVLARA